MEDRTKNNQERRLEKLALLRKLVIVIGMIVLLYLLYLINFETPIP